MAKRKYRPDIKPGLRGTYNKDGKFNADSMDYGAAVLACYIDGEEVPSFPHGDEDCPAPQHPVRRVEVDLELADGTLVDRVPYPRNWRDDGSKHSFCKPVIDSVRWR